MRTTIVVAFLFTAHCCTSAAQTATFIDRSSETDLRVVSYNILNASIFSDVDPIQAEKFERVVTALDPDILSLQEIVCRISGCVKTAEDVRMLLNTLAPLPGGESWHTYGLETSNVIASKYPLFMERNNVPGTNRRFAMALVDLPDDRYGADVYVMNSHFKCCNTMDPPDPLEPYERQRQEQADSLVNWMRDARTAGEYIDLLPQTPMIVLGDLNIINDPDVYDPLGTLLSGDVFFEGTYGGDSAPDWDGTSLADSHPLHNARGPDDYTWRNDLGQFEPGRLDYILYTDSVIKEANKFILNTTEMNIEEMAATGLQEFDVTVDLEGLSFDHLPVVVDFQLVPEPNSLTLVAMCGLLVLNRIPYRIGFIAWF